jgi:hypothetical protein
MERGRSSMFKMSNSNMKSGKTLELAIEAQAPPLGTYEYKFVELKKPYASLSRISVSNSDYLNNHLKKDFSLPFKHKFSEDRSTFNN